MMPNCTHCPLSKKVAYKIAKTKSTKHSDTASETPYKVKYRTLFCIKSEKKYALALNAPLVLLAGCLTFRLERSLLVDLKKIFHFNLSYLRTTPGLLRGICCWLI
jgi:hypothetical protein